MGRFRVLLFAGVALLPFAPAVAADQLKFGPPPSWVHPQRIPAANPTTAPVALLLQNQQTALQPGKIMVYSEVAFKIQNPQGLAAGNLSIVWQPATDIVTVNKLQIRRGDKIIDVLANGQTFTVLRRETNLEAATLDGTLTGNIQPDGLQEGDIVDFATTIQRSDPVLKGHVEATFGAWNGTPIESAHAELSWPDSIHLNVRETGITCRRLEGRRVAVPTSSTCRRGTLIRLSRRAAHRSGSRSAGSGKRRTSPPGPISRTSSSHCTTTHPPSRHQDHCMMRWRRSAPPPATLSIGPNWLSPSCRTGSGTSRWRWARAG